MSLTAMKFRYFLLSFAVIAALMITPFFTAQAETPGGGSVQGYAADSPIDVGTIVQLTGSESNRVKVATEKDMQNMFGVVVNKNAQPITLSNSGIENETYVAVSGTYKVLVSTQGGSIASGDYVTLSSINGIAMKAGTEEPTVFGRANEPFDGKGTTLGATDLKDVNGATSEKVSLGSVSVTIDIRSNPNDESTEVNVPEPLKRLGAAIAEKEVSPIRIYLSLGITVVSIIAAIAILYSGVRNSIVAIGRNPMTKKSIFRALLEIILTSLLILIVGLFAVYLLLRL
jgi:hypothetical protein